MKVKIMALGIQFFYPFGSASGLFQTLRRYLVEAEDGRIDTIEEWDEPEIANGTYEFSEEAVDKIFNRPVELAEDEW